MMMLCVLRVIIYNSSFLFSLALQTFSKRQNAETSWTITTCVNFKWSIHNKNKKYIISECIHSKPEKTTLMLIH